jgi:hypothetical protein
MSSKKKGPKPKDADDDGGKEKKPVRVKKAASRYVDATSKLC